MRSFLHPHEGKKEQRIGVALANASLIALVVFVDFWVKASKVIYLKFELLSSHLKPKM